MTHRERVTLHDQLRRMEALPNHREGLNWADTKDQLHGNKGVLPVKDLIKSNERFIKDISQ